MTESRATGTTNGSQLSENEPRNEQYEADTVVSNSDLVTVLPHVAGGLQADSSRVFQALQEITGLVNTVCKRIDSIEEKISQQQEVKEKGKAKSRKALPALVIAKCKLYMYSCS